MSIELYRCENCEKGFFREQDRDRHEKSAHKERPVYATDEEMRELTDYVYVRANSFSTRPRLHLPNGEGDTICQAVTHDNDWIRRELIMVPQGYSEWCMYCRKEVDNGNY